MSGDPRKLMSAPMRAEIQRQLDVYAAELRERYGLVRRDPMARVQDWIDLRAFECHAEVERMFKKSATRLLVPLDYEIEVRRALIDWNERFARMGFK